MTYLLFSGVAAALGLISFLSLRHNVRRGVASAGLTAVLVGFFALWVVLVPAARHRPLLAAALFAGAIALFRLMGRFERPR